MKKIFLNILLLAFISMLIYSCEEDSPLLEEEVLQTENFDWLLGYWKRENTENFGDSISTEDQKTTYESWTYNKDQGYIGEGCTLKGDSTIFYEDLRLVKKENIWNLEVTGVNENPTYFVFTEYTDTSFVCVNPENEFPKKIIYFIEGDKLKATISSDDFAVDFSFNQIFKD